MTTNHAHHGIGCPDDAKAGHLADEAAIATLPTSGHGDASHGHRWFARAFYADGKTALYPLGEYKRAARRSALGILHGRNRYVAVVVVDGYEEFEPVRRDVFTLPSCRNFAAAHAVGSFLRAMGAKPLADDLREQGLTAEDLSRPDVLADTLAAGWTTEDIANERAAIERVALNETAAELSGDRTVTIEETAAMVEWCREWVADCYGEDEANVWQDADFLRNANRQIDGGLVFVLEDVRRLAREDAESDAIESAGAFTGTAHTLDDATLAIAARLAEGAAMSWVSYGELSEDVRTVRDILNDLPSDRVVGFLAKVARVAPYNDPSAGGYVDGRDILEAASDPDSGIGR